MSDFRIGIIGGSGLGDALPGLTRAEIVGVDTPFGKPSAPITLGELDGVPVALLARHGSGHRLNPSQVPYRANIFALKKVGVTHVIASGAVGSLQDAIAPRHLALPDQVIDRTHRRESTFFDDLAVHVELASPFCTRLREALIAAAGDSSTVVHRQATYVCMEGPQFSTRAESELHRAWGAHLIGMTVMPEAKLAREAELCYAMVALPTDYDCWKRRPEALDDHALVKEIIGNLQATVAHGMAVIRQVLPRIGSIAGTPCSCQSALSVAIWSDRSRIPAPTRERLSLLLGRTLS